MDKSYCHADNRCNLCNGSVGRLNESGAHNLCTEMKKLGMATPSLGERCTGCKGIGCNPGSANGPMLFLDNGPGRIAAAIEAWARKCKRCGGSGVEPGTCKNPIVVKAS